jgi:murein L,D-transpeptidase YcbB/YkuD
MTRSPTRAVRARGRRSARAVGILALGIAALWGLDWGHRPGARQARPPQAQATLDARGPTGRSWVDASGRLTRDGRDALALLATAPADGLDPDDYQVDRLAASLADLERSRPPDPAGAATADRMLGAAVLRYLQHLHLGRIDPRAVGVRLVVEPERHDFAEMLDDALAAHDLASLAASLAPPLPQYAALRRELARYRAIGGAGGGPLPAPAGALRPGDAYPGAEGLRRRLQAFGDLPAGAPPPADPGSYDEVLAEGVRRFQVRHGLEPDGVLGAATRAALDVPVERRIRQIELALERLRWLPDFGDERVIALNIPMFRLWTSDGVGTNEPGPTMRAIVGRALSTETPVFTALLRSVVFRPYWNVPRSILVKEILPAIRRDPDLLQRSDYEAVRGQGDAAEVVPVGPETPALLRDGTLRLRQRPGPANALGLVKFVFPNDADVYLHGTPAVALFGRARRDFSHGCIRVEEPAALAEWVLREEPGWDRARIEAAMAAASSSAVELSRPIRVVLFYTTAVVMPEDGSLRFAPDIYRHDARLDGALARARPRS